MDKKRKKFFILVIILVGGISLVKAFGFLYIQKMKQKPAVYMSELKALSEQKGFKVQEKVAGNEKVTASLELWLNEEVVITYFDFVSEDDAYRYFGDSYEKFKEEEDTQVNKCLVLGDYARCSTSGDELYQCSVRFKDTLFEYAGEMKNKETVQQFMKEVGY